MGILLGYLAKLNALLIRAAIAVAKFLISRLPQSIAFAKQASAAGASVFSGNAVGHQVRSLVPVPLPQVAAVLVAGAILAAALPKLDQFSYVGGLLNEKIQRLEGQGNNTKSRRSQLERMRRANEAMRLLIVSLVIFADCTVEALTLVN